MADLQRQLHYVRTFAEAAAVSMARGTDLDCNDRGNDYSSYLDAVKSGLLPVSRLDAAVKRLLRARFELGLFDPPAEVPYAQTPASANDSAAHRQLAREAARESMVLLKNNGVLPLAASLRRIAVVGPLAPSIRALESNYHGRPSRAVSALDGLRAVFGAAQVGFAPGARFPRELAAVPAEALRTEQGLPGLKAEYFADTELKTRPVATRIDRTVDTNFGGAAPAPGLRKENFSVRWSGYLVAAATGAYQVGVRAEGERFRLWLDGRPAVQDWSSHPVPVMTAAVNLQAGHRYPLTLEYSHEGGDGQIQLIWLRETADPLAEAVAVAKQADVVVAVVGITADLEGEQMNVDVPGFKGGDRTSLDLPQEEEALLQAVKAAGKPLVVVLMSGSALAVNWAARHADAILAAWYPGEEGGTAIAETLAGWYNPAGPPAGHVLHRRGPVAAVRGLLHAGAHLPVLPGRAPLSLRVRPQLRALPVRRPEARERALTRGRPASGKRGCDQRGRARGRRGGATLPDLPARARHAPPRAARLQPAAAAARRDAACRVPLVPAGSELGSSGRQP